MANFARIVLPLVFEGIWRKKSHGGSTLFRVSLMSEDTRIDEVAAESVADQAALNPKSSAYHLERNGMNQVR